MRMILFKVSMHSFLNAFLKLSFTSHGRRDVGRGLKWSGAGAAANSRGFKEMPIQGNTCVRLSPSLGEGVLRWFCCGQRCRKLRSELCGLRSCSKSLALIVLRQLLRVALPSLP